MKYIFFAFLAFLFSCQSLEVNTILVQNTGQTQGTFYHIQYMSENGESYKNQIDSLLLEIDSSLSTYVDFSR
jgi:thiamine biosynthesis lipoprotein